MISERWMHPLTGESAEIQQWLGRLARVHTVEAVKGGTLYRYKHTGTLDECHDYLTGLGFVKCRALKLKGGRRG